MPKTIDRTLPIKRYKKVVATVDLPGVPEGTVGKVRVANGVTWYRYWVDFENGVRLGQVGHQQVCHEADWNAFQADRAEAERRAAEAPDESADDSDDVAASGDGAGNAFGVPEHLLERSRAARARLAG
ncbi:MAG: hypothetical protein VYD46_05965 [Actinomycetota bacterium]|nr:hypothetical protein [Actinomycetota bacterium]